VSAARNRKRAKYRPLLPATLRAAGSHPWPTSDLRAAHGDPSAGHITPPLILFGRAKRSWDLQVEAMERDGIGNVIRHRSSAGGGAELRSTRRGVVEVWS
jgi:hypothetical protein